MRLGFKDASNIGDQASCCRRTTMHPRLERRICRIPDRVVSAFGAGDGHRWKRKIVVLMNIAERYRRVGVAMIALRVQFSPAREIRAGDHFRSFGCLQHEGLTIARSLSQVHGRDSVEPDRGSNTASPPQARRYEGSGCQPFPTVRTIS